MFVIVVIAKFLNVDKICLWLQCLLFVIVGLNWLTILTILLIWLSRTVISSQHEKILSGKRYQSDVEVTSAVENYFEGQ